MFLLSIFSKQIMSPIDIFFLAAVENSMAANKCVEGLGLRLDIYGNPNHTKHSQLELNAVDLKHSIWLVGREINLSFMRLTLNGS